MTWGTSRRWRHAGCVYKGLEVAVKGFVGLFAGSEKRCRLGAREDCHGVYVSGGTGQSEIKEK